MSNTMSTEAYLTHLADLANVPQQSSHRPWDAGINRWLSHRPTRLPHSVIPDRSIKPTPTISTSFLFPRYGHAVSDPTPDGNVYIFGGEAASGAYLNDLWLYSTKDQTTRLFQYYGDPPSPRRGPAIFVTGNVLALWGGIGHHGFDECLYLLDLVSHKLVQIRVHGETPVGRVGHAFATVGSALFIFGGCSRARSQCLNDIWTFDLKSLRSQPAWELIEPSSPIKPSPRVGHQWVLYQNQLITFNGSNNTRFYNDIWSFDLEKLIWTEIQHRGQIPSGRINFAATIANDMIYIHGGNKNKNLLSDFAIFKLSTQQWFEFEHTRPGPRAAHSMVSVGTSIYVFGGESPYSRPGTSQLILGLLARLSGTYVRDNSDLVYVFDTAKLVEELNLHTLDEPTEMKEGIGGGENKKMRNGEDEETGARDANTSEGQTNLRNDQEQATEWIFFALIESPGEQGQDILYSKFLLEGVCENPETEVEENWKFSINTDIAMTSFHSRGADENPPRQLLRGTYQRMAQLTGFDWFHGNIGKGRFYLRTQKGVVVKGEIVGGPPRGQSFSGTGTWYRG